jgi:hypothetical protein
VSVLSVELQLKAVRPQKKIVSKLMAELTAAGDIGVRLVQRILHEDQNHIQPIQALTPP